MGIVDYYHCHDANYNVTAVVDNSGVVVERYDYSPYGQVTFLAANLAPLMTQATTIGNTHLYTVRELDSETGLQLNRNRFYASWLGRWVTRDPIGYNGGSSNLYEYGESTPIISTDQSGLCWPPGYGPFGPIIPPGTPGTPSGSPCLPRKPCKISPFNIYEEAEKRRKGPSAHHCWAACMYGAYGFGVGGAGAAGIESIAEIYEDWGAPDMWGDIGANFQGAGCGAAALGNAATGRECPEDTCDKCCGT